MDLESRLPSWLARLLPRRRRLKVAVARQKGKNRSGTFTIITFGAAATAFVLAFVGVGPFAVQALVVSFAGSQLPASQIFPAVSPATRVVTVYDPPKTGGTTTNPKPSPSPGAKASPSPSASPHRSPRPTPPPDN